jgi:hypothetical protein
VADRLQIGDVAHLLKVWTTDETRGTLERGSTQLRVEDAAGYAYGNTVLIAGAGAAGGDLITTIADVPVAGTKTLLLADPGETAVTNTTVGRTVDPTTTCVVTAPSGTQTTIGATQIGPGQYQADYPITEAGVHDYTFIASGAATGADSGSFDAEPVASSGLAPTALISVGELKQFIGNMAADDDGNLTAAINAASARITRAANREFVARNAVRNPTTGAVTVAPQARRFVIDRSLVNGRLLWVGDIAATTWTTPTTGALTMSTYATVSGTPTVLTVADLGYQPAVRDPWEPITRIHIPTTIGLVAEWELEITAVWGFPRVPDDIKEACKQLAYGSWLRDPRRRSRQLDETGQDLPRTLIGAAMRTARDYNNRPPITALTFA